MLDRHGQSWKTTECVLVKWRSCLQDAEAAAQRRTLGFDSIREASQAYEADVAAGLQAQSQASEHLLAVMKDASARVRAAATQLLYSSLQATTVRSFKREEPDS